MPSSTRWRWRVAAVGEADYGGFAEVEFAETPGGANIAGEGTLIFGTQTDSGGHAAANAFDGNAATLWASAQNGVSAGTAWVGREWPTPRSVEEVRARARNDQWYYQAGTINVAEWWDGAAWQPYGPPDQWGIPRFYTVWAQGEAKTFTLTPASAPDETSIYQAAGYVLAGAPPAEAAIAQAAGFLLAGAVAGEATIAQACGFLLVNPAKTVPGTRTRIWRLARGVVRNVQESIFPLEIPLINPGAEFGTFTGWEQVEALPMVISTGEVRSGTLKFIGQGAGPTQIRQTREIPESAWNLIDAGGVIAVGASWQRAASLGADDGSTVLEAMDAAGVVLEEVRKTVGNLATTYVHMPAMMILPAGTRKLGIGARDESTDSVRRIDDFDPLRLYRLVTLPLLNPGFESGDLGAWFQETGLGAAVAANHGGVLARSGGFHLRVGAAATATVSQDVSIPSAYHAAVDAGQCVALIRAWLAGYTDSDAGEVRLAFRDAGGTVMATTSASGLVNGDATWRRQATGILIPAGARQIRARLYGDRTTGTNLDAYFDDVELFMGVP